MRPGGVLLQCDEKMQNDDAQKQKKGRMVCFYDLERSRVSFCLAYERAMVCDNARGGEPM